jgi:hypothetical protein
VAKIIPQAYPRIDDPTNPQSGCLDDSQLVSHFIKIPETELQGLISTAIINANKKSSRQILPMSVEITSEERQEMLKREGKNYFLISRSMSVILPRPPTNYTGNITRK